MLGGVLAGGASAASDSDCLVVGGHTVDDKEPKYGMAVIGMVHPDRILRNQGARPGDRIYLSKPLGTGIIATAMKGDLASPDQMDASLQSMMMLNRAAAAAAVAVGANALTDVTGFGLAGHLSEMLGRDSRLGATIHIDALPILPGVREHTEMGLIPEGAYRNRDAYKQRVQVAEAHDAMSILIYDPQTSGGLLAAIPPDSWGQFEQEASRGNVRVTCIGEFDESGVIGVK
jgi:selenide,water dikinase